jgi:hypothetical protein
MLFRTKDRHVTRHAITSGLFLLAVLLFSSSHLLADDNSDAWAKSLATTLSAAFDAHDIPAGDATFDMNAFLDRVTTGVTAPNGFDAVYRKAFQSKSVLGLLINGSDNGGTSHFLRTRHVRGQVWALCRLLTKKGSLDYAEWVLGADAQGSPKFVDVYSLVSGERVSQALRRSYIANVSRGRGGGGGSLTNADRDVAANATTVWPFVHDFNTARYSDALDAYKSLPASLQQIKPIMAMRVLAAENVQTLRPDDYTSALADIQAAYPKDPCVDLLSFDSLLRQKDFDGVHQILDRLQTFTGGDSYLQYLQGNIDLMQGGNDRLADAQTQFQNAIAAEPTLVQPYWGMLRLSLKTRNFDQTAAMLDALRKTFNVRFNNLETVAAYAEFVKSDAYAKWKAEQN